MDDRFMYQIRPRKPIVNLIPGKGIRKPMSIKLTKEEVKKCITYGPVYRAFPSIPPIRVTGSNLDSLHVTEEEYLNKDKKETKPSDTAEKPVEEPIQETVVPEEPNTEPLTEEVTEERPVFHVDEPEEKEPEPIPVPVEPGPVIIEEKKEEVKEEEPEPVPVPVEPGPVIPEEEPKEEEPIPVPVEPGPVIVEPEEPVAVGVVEAQEEVEDEEDEEEDDEEEEVAPLGPVTNGQLQPQQPRKKK